jgi:hypothetical protein
VTPTECSALTNSIHPSCTKRRNFISLCGAEDGGHCSGLLTTGEIYNLNHLKSVQVNGNSDSTYFLNKFELQVLFRRMVIGLCSIFADLK